MNDFLTFVFQRKIWIFTSWKIGSKISRVHVNSFKVEDFSEKVPEGAVVVVNYVRRDQGMGGFQYGTALIPKDYKPQESESPL